jgi:hypothetical protein
MHLNTYIERNYIYVERFGWDSLYTCVLFLFLKVKLSRLTIRLPRSSLYLPVSPSPNIVKSLERNIRIMNIVPVLLFSSRIDLLFCIYSADL